MILHYLAGIKAVSVTQCLLTARISKTHRLKSWLVSVIKKVLIKLLGAKTPNVKWKKLHFAYEIVLEKLLSSAKVHRNKLWANMWKCHLRSCPLSIPSDFWAHRTIFHANVNLNSCVAMNLIFCSMTVCWLKTSSFSRKQLVPKQNTFLSIFFLSLLRNGKA